ncbi:hypothetical protein PAXRUDRAFT_830536 [Paxillus rubicundulus Ve08.2h10]|uniref:Uncharacterized protein n=1 Tax=Paxillus rubicundulus Ve08.2h10 TaxID=930991 RepID=A0A0D0E3U6_9AGAM|nr:hypothetical protein PAXRUDRAFT_830536 [Paxillus rubicundulus Ve08.2h10]
MLLFQSRVSYHCPHTHTKLLDHHRQSRRLERANLGRNRRWHGTDSNPSRPGLGAKAPPQKFEW